MLTDGHHPDGFNQRVAGIPCVNNQASLSKTSLCRCFSVRGEGEKQRQLMINKSLLEIKTEINMLYKDEKGTVIQSLCN